MEIRVPTRLWKTIYVFILLAMLIGEGTCHDTEGFVFFRFLCYENPSNKDSKGFICDSLTVSYCDPYFTICVSDQPINDGFQNENCPILYKVTDSYKNQKTICSTPQDNRGLLAADIIKEFKNPLKKIYYVRIEIRDSNVLTDYKPLIASFSAQFEQSPAPNLSAPLFKVPVIYRNEFRYANPQTKLEFSMALQCGSNMFGEYCQTSCRENILGRFVCSEKGEKICEKGWKGKDCLESDLCFFQQCAEGARCIENDRRAYCMCDGKIGPKCYPNYDPCVPNPCINSGICVHNKSSERGISCLCHGAFFGQRCEYRMRNKEINPCFNDGKFVYDSRNKLVCKCMEGFYGNLCQDKLVNPILQHNFNKTPMVHQVYSRYKFKIFDTFFILRILTVVFFLMFVIMITVYCFKRSKSIKFYKSLMKKYRERRQQQSEKPELLYTSLKKKRNEDSSETTYETVDDDHSTSYVMKENDEYVMPSKPKLMFNSIQNTLYEELVEEKCKDPITNKKVKERDKTFTLPSLPRRSIKRKSSLGLLLN